MLCTVSYALCQHPKIINQLSLRHRNCERRRTSSLEETLPSDSFQSRFKGFSVVVSTTRGEGGADPLACCEEWPVRLPRTYAARLLGRLNAPVRLALRYKSSSLSLTLSHHSDAEESEDASES